MPRKVPVDRVIAQPAPGGRLLYQPKYPELFTAPLCTWLPKSYPEISRD